MPLKQSTKFLCKTCYNRCSPKQTLA
uniref:Uncharacterized protein n=1 Tax=Anguilla anguilla TaxID=7936 RepID=A0A0E9UJD3_ANGAN